MLMKKLQVQGWSRRAQQCNMQLIPVPGDPFALPYSSNSDPLRGPIFIPLAIDSIVDPGWLCSPNEASLNRCHYDMLFL